ncbi:MAG: tyrosine-type recombinase/integrase [Betaproteobacteria bacterium]
MSIRRRGNIYQVRIRLGGGRRIERSLPVGATRTQAQALETRLKHGLLTASAGSLVKRTIDDALDRWIETDAKALKSWERDLRYRIGILREYTAGRPLEDLPDVADRIKAAGQKNGLTPASVNRYVALLRRVGNLAERWAWTDAPLGRRVVLLPENSQRHVYLTADQVRALQAATDPLTADMIAFAVLTGLRRSELLRLQPDQLRGRVLALDANTKSGRPRGLPLPPEAVTIARRRLPWNVEYWELRKRFDAARVVAGLPTVRWHDLRHTYASWLAQRGQPLTAIRDLMGHSSLAVTNRYSHLSPAHLRGAVDTLPRIGGVKAGSAKRARKRAA